MLEFYRISIDFYSNGCKGKYSFRNTGGSQANQAETKEVTPLKKEVIKVKITKLLAAGFIKEVYHPEWLANPILAEKRNGKWHICVDYTNLNHAYPKNPFGLPESIKLWVPLWVMTCLSFLTATQAIIRLV